MVVWLCRFWVQSEDRSPSSHTQINGWCLPLFLQTSYYTPHKQHIGGPVIAQTKSMGWSVVAMLSAGQPDQALLHTVPAHLIRRVIEQYEAEGKVGKWVGGCG